MTKRIVLAVAAALCGASAFALVYVPVSDAALADGAEIVARVELAGGQVAEIDGRVVTRYEATVLDLVKGLAGGSRLVIEVPGGVDPAASRAVHIPGTPRFAAGDRALLFLSRGPAGAYRVLHLSQGAFRELPSRRGAVLVRDLTESWELRRAAGGEVSVRPGGDLARDRALFVEWLRDRGAGRTRAADYLVTLPAPEAAAIQEKFTLLGDRNLTARWFVFDDGGRLRWFRHQEGQAGLARGGRREFNRARRAWNRSRTPVKLSNGGGTASTGGFATLDGRNTILFRDFNDTIGSDFDCDSGGVLAIGGLSDLSPRPRPYKNLGVFESYEAEIVVNDGVECLFALDSRIAAQVYAHELGHTLGLGHSCGDSASPRCSRSAVLDEALMRASLSRVFGAELREDDLSGIRMLYDDQFFAVPCETSVPGSRAFCRRCGPCGAGQGNCRDDRDCEGILVCEKDAGAAFGFTAGTDVCVEP